MVVGSGSGVYPLALEVRWLEVSVGYHHFHQHCDGIGVFVSVQKNNADMLHKNPKYKMVKYSENSMHDMIVLKILQKVRTMKMYQERT